MERYLYSSEHLSSAYAKALKVSFGIGVITSTHGPGE